MISGIKSAVIILSLSIFFISCSTTKKIEALKPEPSKNAPVVYNTETSFINMPLEIPLKEIENQINKNLTGDIYIDNDIQNDNAEVKVTKTAPIRLVQKNNKIETIVPLKIWSRFKYGSEMLGLSDTREVNLNGTFSVLSDVKLSNWKLNTNSSIENVDWAESPTISVAGKNVPITYLINPALALFKKQIAKEIDKAIQNSCDFKPYVMDVLKEMSKPVLTDKQYQAWFSMIPQEVYVTDATLKNSSVNMGLGLKCNMQTYIGSKPQTTFDKNNIQFKTVTDMPDKVTANVAAISTYENAAKFIRSNFNGKQFTSGKRKITVQNVDLWQKDGKIIIALGMTGSVDGTIYLTGVPNYDPKTKEIFFDQMDYVLDTKGLLTKTANWLLQGVILKNIQENCRYSIKENLEVGKKSLEPYLNNYSPMKGVFINGKLTNFDFDKVKLTDNAIVAFIVATGKMNIKIEGMD